MTMIKTVKINGEEYPVSFGLMALADFCKMQGLSFVDLTTNLSDKLDLHGVLSLIHTGIKDGCRKAKKDFSLTIADVADLLDSDPTALERVLEQFTDSLPGTKGKSKGK